MVTRFYRLSRDSYSSGAQIGGVGDPYDYLISSLSQLNFFDCALRF
jgi:hypothetical protein